MPVTANTPSPAEAMPAGAQMASPCPAACQPLTVGGVVDVSIATTLPWTSTTQSPEWPPYGTYTMGPTIDSAPRWLCVFGSKVSAAETSDGVPGS